METPTAGSLLVSLLSVVIVIGVAKVFNFLWWMPKKQERWLRQQGFPGTCYRVPFGDLKDYFSMRDQALDKPMNSLSHDYVARVEPFGNQLKTKFGRDFFMWFGPIPAVRLSKPELVREASTRIWDFPKPRFNPIIEKLFPGIFTKEGEQWAQHKRIINPAFHMEKLKLMLPAFIDSCTEMINKWEKLVAETASVELDAWPYISTLAADVISRAAFGSSYEEGQKIFQLLKEQIDLGLSMLESVYIPGILYIPTTRNRRFKELDDEIYTSLRGIINKRKQEMYAGEPTKDDLLGILIESNLRKTQQAAARSKMDRQCGLSLQEVIANCKGFYSAGQETTAILIVWTLILLSKQQDWQARARQEVLQTFESRAPYFEGLSHLKTVTMILYEVLRMYPPLVRSARMTNKDTALGNLSLPAGIVLFLDYYSIHRDKEIWGEDAEEFNPERFSEGISKATNGNHAFFPFGWGPRACIGEKFSLIKAKMVLSMILQRFSFQLSPSYAHAPMVAVTLKPQHGAHIILHRL